MRKQVFEHINLYEAIRGAGLTWDVLAYGSTQKILQVCHRIGELGLEKAVYQMQEPALKYLFTDTGFIDKIPLLLKEGIDLQRIIALIAGAGTELLSRYDYSDLRDTLADDGICSNVQFLYLKYYHGYQLDGHQKETLCSGLHFSGSYMKVELGGLEEWERKLFYEPVFSSDLLKGAVACREDLQEFAKPGMLPLLNYLQEKGHSHFDIGKTQWEQLKEDPEAIRKGLLETVPKMKQEDVPSFLKIWLENGALQFDLNRLKREIPKKTEEERHHMARTRTAYISVIYGGSIEEIPLEGLVREKEKLLIYAITHKKKHFLSIVREHPDAFRSLPKYSLLFDPDVYMNYININAMNEKEFDKCFALMSMGQDIKQFMVNSQYLFSELELLSGLSAVYVRLFHKLQYPRSDDRLRIFREVSKKRCLPESLEESEIKELGEMLSQKALSQWMQGEFAHIRGIYPEDAIRVLSHWEQAKRFVPEMGSGGQVRFLLKNMKILDHFANFEEMYVRVLEMEPLWKELRREFKLTDEFVAANKENIQNFLYQDGAEIMHAFLLSCPEKKEQIRRILTAELLGRFSELKYHENDLQKEIDFPITEPVGRTWQENECTVENGFRLWEEDRLLPVMQIGEVPDHTCMSYKDGAYNECLLSCFDSNKKILQASIDGKIVFRAILRLTKGCFIIRKEESDIEFTDLTVQPKTVKKEKQQEELALFLERPYFRWLSDEKRSMLTTGWVRLLRKKAKKLGARLVISTSYSEYGMSGTEDLVLSRYHLYISASKNGCQYLDSLGGKASVSSARSYAGTRFWIDKTEDCIQKAA